MIWKDVIYCDLYEISDEGIVRRKSNRNVLKGCVSSGYRSVKLTYPDGHQQRFYVHRLVAIHFIENYDPKKTHVNHKDGNKMNNHVENLEWVSPRENNIHYYQEVQQEKREYKKGCSKAIPVIQIENGKELARFPSMKKASEATGISVVQIARCLHGETSHTGPYIWIQQ